MNYLHFRIEGMRRMALVVLSLSPDYRATLTTLRDALSAAGFSPSADVLRTQVAWLAEQGAVTVAEEGPNLSIALTERGEDIAAGHASVPGIAVPTAGRALIEARIAGILADLVR